MKDRFDGERSHAGKGKSDRKPGVGAGRGGPGSGKNAPPRREKRAGQPGKPAKAWQARPETREPADDVCWGRQPVLDLVRTASTRCTKLVIANNVRPPFLDEVVDAARAGRIVYQMVAPEALDALCPGVRHQGVACRISEAKLTELEPFLRALPQDSPALIVVLDHIEDPHNLGAVVRSAEAAGAVAVAFPKRRSALPGGTVMKVSAGAALRVPMIPVVNVTRTVEQLKEAGFWTVGLENEAAISLWDEGEKLQPRTAFVVGSEDEGISRLVGEACDQLLRIPIRGGVGSLNASVAAALGMFEWSRKYIHIKGRDIL
ncbi:MAG: 23S rRNA (guanosine(2251)-2'-O)-methyltransferase RlmB [Synergistaceae bacterium]|jgi:23S rRNA (guanosine2251-2'-O)-methyltransferase|nr:23S rRNA (guanosine(2251)-2'-O)-methyltransferase RlmB [Synergistaceae bacterium]